MFKESAAARYVLRAAVATALAVLGALQLALANGVTAQEWVQVAIAGCISLGGYLGIGALSGSVEPFIGNTLQGAQVPSPPADPEPPGAA